LPDGSGILVGSDDGSVHRINPSDPGNARLLWECGGRVGDLALSADGSRVAAAAENGIVAVFGVGSGEVLAQIRVSVPYSVVFLHGDRTVCIGATGALWLWDWQSPDQPRLMGSVDGPVLGMASSADGARLYTVSDDVAAWDRSSVPMKPEHVTALGVSDDDRSAFAGLWDGTLVVVDLLAGRGLFRFPAHTKVITAVAQAGGSGEVLTCSLDPDLGGGNDFVRIWRLLDPEPLVPHPGRIGEPATVGATSSPTPAQQWTDRLRSRFETRYGADPDPGRTGVGPDELDPASLTDADRATTDRPEAEDSIRTLRAALVRAPQSPESNLELAQALTAAGKPAQARDHIRRVLRLGRADLLTEPATAYLAAEALLNDGQVEDALPFLRRAADQDEPAALLQLGLLSMQGEGVPLDHGAGAEYFRRSAERGNAVAAYNLGVYDEQVRRGSLSQTNWRTIAFGTGDTTPPLALRQAFEWYLKGAEGGYPAAQVRIGDFYAEGRLVEKDLDTARRWYERAAMEDYQPADERLAELGTDGP
jgi:TPR repeat protein